MQLSEGPTATSIHVCTLHCDVHCLVFWLTEWLLSSAPAHCTASYIVMFCRRMMLANSMLQPSSWRKRCNSNKLQRFRQPSRRQTQTRTLSPLHKQLASRYTFTSMTPQVYLWCTFGIVVFKSSLAVLFVMLKHMLQHL